jgi:two-component system, OmpR family, phosphate regulon response regulator OmpR
MNNAINILHSIPHILVVDDDEKLRKLLARYLNEQGLVVTCAANAEDARAKLQFFKYDAMVLDMMMPNQTGIEFMQTANIPLPPTLMLTAMGEVSDRIKGLEAGADDYLSKPFEPKELVLRLQKIINRTKISHSPQQTINFGDFSLDLNKKRLHQNGDIVHLTEAEMAMLLLLASNVNQVVAREKLLQNIAQNGGSEENNLRAVDVLITRIRRKIEADPARPIYLQTARGEGYILRN